MNRKKLYWSVFFSANLIYIIVAYIGLWMMFESIAISVVLTICFMPIFVKKIKIYLESKRQQRMESEFYKMLGRISMSMSSGMILENALKETVVVDKKDYKLLGDDFEKMYRMLQNNYSIDVAFRTLAQRSNNREIKTFCEVLSAGMPTGIDISGLIRYLSAAYRMREDTEGEIIRILNAPKYNNRIIIIMPFICITLFKQLAPSYMDSLYTDLGRVIMIVVLAMLLAAGWLGEKLGKIEY